MIELLLGERGWGRRMLFLGCALVLAFLVLPLFVIVPLSFNSGSFLVFPLEGFSLRWYETVLTDPRWLSAGKNSLIVGLSATAASLAIGVPMAMALSFYVLPGRAFFALFAGAPLVVPPVILAIGLFFLMSSLQLTYSLPGLIIAHTVLGLPFVIITVSAALSGFDRTLLKAAASLGASPMRVFRTVLLPLTWPAITTGGLLAFITSFDEVVLVIFLGGPGQRTLPREMFDSLRESFSPSILALATLLTLVSTALMLISLRARAKTEGISF